MGGREPTYLTKLGKIKKGKKTWSDEIPKDMLQRPKLPKVYDKTSQHVQSVRLTRFFETPICQFGASTVFSKPKPNNSIT
jgi:hypothetical protein